jgi:hypothetical protein
MPDTSRWHRHPAPGTREHGNPGHAAQVTHIGARARHLVERLRDEADRDRARELQKPSGYPGPEWTRGIADAARWALGELENAPVTRTFTGRGVCPDVPTMRAEDHKADAAIRRPSEVGVSSTYANGVQHALMWITGDTEESPIGLGA